MIDEKKVELAKEAFLKGLQCFDDKDFLNAEKHFYLSLDFLPNRPSTLLNLSIAQFKLRKITEALSAAERAHQIDSDDLSIMNQFGLMLQQNERFDEANLYFAKCIERDPLFTDPYINMANCYRKIKKYDLSLKYYNDAIIQAPDLYEAYANRGLLYVDLNRLSDAMTDYDKAIHLSADRSLAYINRGTLLCMLEKWHEAKADFIKAFECEPFEYESIVGFSSLPSEFLSENDVRKLLKSIDSIKWSDRLYDLLFIRANLLKKIERYDESFKLLVQANNLKRAKFSDVETEAFEFTQLKNKVDSWIPNNITAGNSTDPKLVFILGPSRSGKTTFERLISINSILVRGYEQSIRAQQFEEIINWVFSCSNTLDVNRLEIGREKLKFLIMKIIEMHDPLIKNQGLALTNPFLLDYAHAIFEIYPNSYFVFIERNQMDVASEIFSKNYIDPIPYFYAKYEIIKYVKNYYEVTKKLNSKMGIRSINIKYEDILISPKRTLKDFFRMIKTDVSPDFFLELDGHIKNIESPYKNFFEHLK